MRENQGAVVSVFYAVLTGVILGLAGVVGRWFDNMRAYHDEHIAVPAEC